MRAANPILTPKLITPLTPLQKAFSLVLNGLFTALGCWRLVIGKERFD
jgi:hypothetical protein